MVSNSKLVFDLVFFDFLSAFYIFVDQFWFNNGGVEVGEMVQPTLAPHPHLFPMRNDQHDSMMNDMLIMHEENRCG